MKLILSSSDFCNENSRKVIFKNLDKDLCEYRMLFIPNEKATLEEIKSDKYYERLKEYGFLNRDNIYIYNELETDKFRNLDIDLIYVSGGNTFATLEKLRKNHFDYDIINYVLNGVIYIGGSCGAHIVTQNIEHVSNFDENYVGETNFNGLGLFDGIIVCHYDDSRSDVYQKLVNEKNYNVYKLTNDESLVVIDHQVIQC